MVKKIHTIVLMIQGASITFLYVEGNERCCRQAGRAKMNFKVFSNEAQTDTAKGD
uniref:Uncharacterized protein n=1 Tax=viral metagenome TaxID=1070528 RepID=A0A6M3L0N0_9ZZZZ